MTTAIQQSMFLVPQGSLEGYIQTVNSIPVLTAAEERELAERLQQQGDLEAARQLVMSHLRFVVHIARSYAGYGLPQAQELAQAPLAALLAQGPAHWQQLQQQAEAALPAAQREQLQHGRQRVAQLSQQVRALAAAGAR